MLLLRLRPALSMPRFSRGLQNRRQPVLSLFLLLAHCWCLLRTSVLYRSARNLLLSDPSDFSSRRQMPSSPNSRMHPARVVLAILTVMPEPLRLLSLSCPP